MFALIYLGLAIALGDTLCRKFYRFVSVPHRYAAAILVGLLLSTWFTYLAALAFPKTAEPLLSADVLFFIVAAGAIFWLSRKASKTDMITPRAPGSSNWDWITLAGLFVAACVLLIGTLYVTKQGQLRLSGTSTSDLGPQLAFAQSFGLRQTFPTGFAHSASQPTHDQFLFYFQAGNLEFLGLNLAWSVDVLSVLGLTSMLALVMVFGQLLFNSRVVGRLGAVLFFFHDSLRHLTAFLTSANSDQDKIRTFWNQTAFLNQRHLPFATGIFFLLLIFLVEQSRQRTTRANVGPTRAKSFVFSGLLLAALPLSKAVLYMNVVVALCCLLLAWGCWSLLRLKTPGKLGGFLTGTLAAFILALGVIDLLALYSGSHVGIDYDRKPLVKGLLFRTSAVYKIPDSSPPSLVREGLPNPAVTAFEGGQGSGKCQFDHPRGLAVDPGGNIFVADTNNGRIQKFSANGIFIASIGPFEAPNGIAIDRAGNIYVAEVDSKHRVEKVGPDGSFIAAWAPALYGPRRIAIGPDNAIYVVDQGHNRIIKFSPDGEVLTTWGSSGSGDGQFDDHTSVAVDTKTNRVYVADPINSRIQVFESNGKSLTKWSIPEWGQSIGFEDLAIDPSRGRLYASSAHMSAILVFDLQGNRLGTVTPAPPDKLDGPSAIALAKDKLFVLNTDSARVSVIVLQNK